MRRAYSRATVPSTSQNTEVALAVLLRVRVVNLSRGNGKSRHSQERVIQSQGTGNSWMQKCPWAPHPPHSISSRLRNTSCPPLGTLFPDRRCGTTKCRTASSGKTARCSKGCSPFVQHIRDWNSETPALRHQTNPTAAPEGLLPPSSSFFFSPSPSASHGWPQNLSNPLPKLSITLLALSRKVMDSLLLCWLRAQRQLNVVWWTQRRHKRSGTAATSWVGFGCYWTVE